MRLWTVHPNYLDRMGLVALWREALLARAVLEGATRGYRHHPQLTRFRQQADPVGCINAYLAGVFEEASRRGYSFDRRKLVNAGSALRMTETEGQLAAEWHHLLGKLRERQPDRYGSLISLRSPLAHPLFSIVPGDRQEWERSPVPTREP